MQHLRKLLDVSAFGPRHAEEERYLEPSSRQVLVDSLLRQWSVDTFLGARCLAHDHQPPPFAPRPSVLPPSRTRRRSLSPLLLLLHYSICMLSSSSSAASSSPCTLPPPSPCALMRMPAATRCSARRASSRRDALTLCARGDHHLPCCSMPHDSLRAAEQSREAEPSARVREERWAGRSADLALGSCAARVARNSDFLRAGG